MRVLIPVDESGCHTAALDCVKSLQLPDPQIDIVTVIQPLPSMDSSYIAISAIDTQAMVDALHEGGQSSLDVACDDAKSRGFEPKPVLAYGYPASVIADTAATTGVDLIAVGADPKSSLTRMFAGSVTQNLASGAHQSLLIARTAHHPTGRISAVFATDHSDYANRCLDILLAWNPGGFSHIEVLTAYETFGHEKATAGKATAVSPEEVDFLVAKSIGEKTEAVAEKLRQKGISADARVVKGDVRSAIRSTMESLNADLLILGAKGHSYWQRLLIGSTAMHQVAAEPYSILILRA